MKCPKEVRMIDIEEMEKKRFLFGMKVLCIFMLMGVPVGHECFFTKERV